MISSLTKVKSGSRKIRRSVTRSLAVLLGLGSLVCAENGARRLARGDTIWRLDRLGDGKSFGRGLSCERSAGNSKCIEFAVARNPGEPGTVSGLELPLPVEEWSGSVVVLSAEVSSPGTATESPTGGVWFGLDYTGRDGFRSRLPRWRKSEAWSSVAETLDLTGAREGKLHIGIQSPSGTLRFRNIMIRAIKVLPNRPKSSGRRFQTTRLRGINAGTTAIDGFDSLASWKVNSFRWILGGGLGNDASLSSYDNWLDAKLKELDRAVALARIHGVKIVICLFDTPGGRAGGRTLRMFLRKDYSDHFLSTWDRIARHYAGDTVVVGYDLVNEPVQEDGVPGVPDWWEIQILAAKRVRQIDPRPAIYLEVDGFDDPQRFRWLDKPPMENLVYEAHMYESHAFTHQGVYGSVYGMPGGDSIFAYPGVVGGKLLNKDAIRRYLEPVREFQAAYHVPIYIGEFSAARWAPGAARYLDDCSSIFEEYGWDWAYLAFRGASAWDLEIANLPWNRNERHHAPETPDRLMVMKRWWSRGASGGGEISP